VLKASQEKRNFLAFIEYFCIESKESDVLLVIIGAETERGNSGEIQRGILGILS